MNHTIELEKTAFELLKIQINQKENSLTIKDNNQARIVWFDELNKQKTDFVLFCLHLFSTSQYEGYPLHVNFAKRYGCNINLSRLDEQGLHTDDRV